MQISPVNYQYAPNAYTNAPVSANNKAEELKTDDTQNIGECATCASRRYQDDSNDGGVSFQSPTHVSPEGSAAAVMSHEREHMSRNAAFAKAENREVVSSSIQIFTAVCPECGRVYTSGGVTRTVTRAKNDDDVMSVIDVLSGKKKANA